MSINDWGGTGDAATDAFFNVPAMVAARDLCRAIAADLNARAARGGALVCDSAIAVNGGQAGWYVEMRAASGPAFAIVGDMPGPWGLDYMPNGPDSDAGAVGYNASDTSCIWPAATIAAWVWPLWRGLNANR